MELKIFDIPHFLDRKDWIQADLAEKIDISPSAVGMWASGTFPSFDKLPKLLELGMTVEEIFGSKLYKEFILPYFKEQALKPEQEDEFEAKVGDAVVKLINKGFFKIKQEV